MSAERPLLSEQLSPHPKIAMLYQKGNLFNPNNDSSPTTKLLVNFTELIQTSSISGVPPIGIGIIYAEAKKAGYDMDLLDLRKPQNIQKAKEYDLIFWSVIDMSVDIVRKWLTNHSNLHQRAVIGGQGITSSNIEKLMQEFPEVAFVLGRAEGIITQLLTERKYGIYRRRYDNPDFSLQNAANETYLDPHFTFRKLAIYQKARFKGVEVSTGCSQKCSDFCPVSHEKLTFKPFQVLIAEIESMRVKPNQVLLFIDNNLFNLPKNYLIKLFRYLNQHHYLWAGEGTIAQIADDDELLELMGENCGSFLAGLEDIPGANQQIIGSPMKTKLLRNFHNILPKLRQHHIPITWSMLFPLKHHTRESFLKAAQFILKNQLNVNLHLLQPREATGLSKSLQPNQWAKTDTTNRDGLSLVFIPESMTWEDAMAGFIWLESKIDSLPNIFQRLVNNRAHLGIVKSCLLAGIELLADKTRYYIFKNMYPQLKPNIAKYEAGWQAMNQDSMTT